ncbi:HD domain containing protein [Pyrenophora tritici-repentis]|uniref:Cyanamide hydratase n=1 Tax=Pyrenophora tritici-repentis (strain Pt-1C-BFP) TaxID=426418 RepID=B2VWT3_PYRTR|nr:cyanamide hydratase [Pyrenophora tritici-repentis Pt-1C-BFP]EDU41083.1 cyanamide hydratase [Pyrenophora tritici-repentis Pt-1C-BFP]KAI1524575.1 HD domain containing protein [Pyrenophora tritici-repentis]KAI1560715.1 HD domain containing protein [Pyrenophora tritici-repentis]KAI1594283.1 HD domain containing protein [Pyrenophora tritici-repentis]
MISKSEEFGWTAVPRNRSNVPSAEDAKTQDVTVNVSDIWPGTELVTKANDHAKQQLPGDVYDHSLRVYCYGYTIVTQHFPAWASETFFETWALTCLFHDIGTTPSNRSATHLSFEFQGGFIALNKLQELGAPKAQAESVAEAIIRHQDPGETGMVSHMVQLVQLATELDNMGWQPHLVSTKVIEQVVKQLPRKGWSNCFSRTIEVEIAEKPWCHTTSMEGFAEAVAGNELMKRYE